MKTTYAYRGRQYSAYWNEKVYANGACYVTVFARESDDQQKMVFNAKTGALSYGNRTREFANAALASIDAAPFNRFEFGSPVSERDVREAARCLGVSLSTIYRRIHAGKIQARRVRQSNGRWQYMVVLSETSAQAA
jgi:excisionase family DNA binding protein